MIVKSIKLSVLPVYCLEHILHEKRYTTLLERQFKLFGFMQCSFWILQDLNVSIVTRCFHISHHVPPHDLQQPFFFSRGVTPNYRNLLKDLPMLCSVLGVNSKCISDSIVLNFETTG